MSILESKQKNILDYFVFPEIRDVQKKVLLEIQEALKTYDYILVEAPTGSGKSLIAATVANYLGSSYINTASLLLQDQYLRDFKWMYTIKGKSNFECIDPVTEQLKQIRIQELKMQQTLDGDDKLIKSLENKTLGCHEAPCCFKGSYKCTIKPKLADYQIINERTLKEKIIEPSLSNGGTWCHYFNQKNKGFLASHTVMNYKLFFAIYHANANEFLERKRDLLVFDEAHAIPSEVLDFLGLTLSRSHIEKIEKEMLTPEIIKNCLIDLKDLEFPRNNLDDINTWIEYLDKTFIWMDSVSRFLNNKYEKNELDDSKSDILLSLDTLKNRIESILSNIMSDKNNWLISIMNEYYDRSKIKDVKLYPLNIGKYIKPIFDIGNKKLFISATILDKNVFCNMIGVSPDKVKFIRINESPFPIKNRPIYAYNLGEMSYRNMNSLLPTITSNIDAIMTNYLSERGIIHVTNYKTADYLEKNLNEENKKRLFITGGNISQSEVIRKHAESHNGVLLSPSLYQGIDLKDDLARFQIIIKIPYPDISDKYIDTKMKNDYRWYQWQTALRLVQSYGRIVRSISDYGDTYILDSKLRKFIQNKMIPKWFTEAIVWK